MAQALTPKARSSGVAWGFGRGRGISIQDARNGVQKTAGAIAAGIAGHGAAVESPGNGRTERSAERGAYHGSFPAGWPPRKLWETPCPRSPYEPLALAGHSPVLRARSLILRLR